MLHGTTKLSRTYCDNSDINSLEDDARCRQDIVHKAIKYLSPKATGKTHENILNRKQWKERGKNV